jgi:hypothetical protein
MDTLLSLFTMTVYAAELIISPLGSNNIHIENTSTKPERSFAQLSVAPTPAVLGAEIVQTQAAVQPVLKRSAYTIAFLGDSMIDTLGPGIPHLGMLLKKQFPKTTFTLLNFGVGGENIDSGINRITHDYTYLGVSHPSLVSQKPDIVVVESFGYNPMIQVP